VSIGDPPGPEPWTDGSTDDPGNHHGDQMPRAGRSLFIDVPCRRGVAVPGLPRVGRVLDRSPLSGIRVRVGVVVLAVAVLGVAVTFSWAPLNGNLRYEAGVKLVGGSAASTFSHRPLGFRLLMDGVFRVARAGTSTVAGFELAVRVLLAGLTVGASAVLWRGLKRRSVSAAGWYGVVAAGALFLLGPISAGEPDWLAVVLVIAGVGAALSGDRRPWLWAMVAGVLLLAAAAMKIVSLPTAMLGLVAVGLLDRRQMLRCLVASMIVGVAYVLATVIWVPWEIQWLLDIRTVQNSARAELDEAPSFFLHLCLDRPLLLALPAVWVWADRRERLVGAGAVTVGVAMVVAQGQYFEYHAIPLVVVSAIVVLRGLMGRVSTAVGGATLLLVGGCTLLTMVSQRWVNSHERWWAVGLVASAVVMVGYAVMVTPRRLDVRAPALLLAASVTMALMYPGASPWAAKLLRAANADGERPSTSVDTRSRDQQIAARVHTVIGGPDVAVTYLTFGEWTYFLGNPTSCRYPSPLFLQRTRKPARLDTASYRESVACLTAVDSRWLIRDTTWFRVQPQPAEVKDLLAREWDCTHEIAIDELRLCPRR
jgi:hypothetical protein